MRHALKLHPDSRCDALKHIDVEIAQQPAGRLRLSYIVAGKIGDLRLPPAAASGRADGLWRHTCFEAFIHPPEGETYYEFNFSPSTAWAAYRFDGYRSAMQVPPAISAPRIDIQSDAGSYVLQAEIALDDVTHSRLALSAVIEEANGRVSYWALAHPPGKADFHHPDGFVLELP